MKIVEKVFNDEIWIIQNDVYSDSRGYFYESFNKNKFSEIELNKEFVQDNVSFSTFGVIRGLHYQMIPFTQGKLITTLFGEIFDVAVDIRKDSKTFGKWFGQVLTSGTGTQIWIPEGFAHGFETLSDFATIQYKVTAFYNKMYEKTLIWNDPDVNIMWKTKKPNLSIKDLNGIPLKLV